MNRQIEPFPNLSSAGDELARRLVGAGTSHDVIVLGIVSAGIPVAAEVEHALQNLQRKRGLAVAQNQNRERIETGCKSRSSRHPRHNSIQRELTVSIGFTQNQNRER